MCGATIDQSDIEEVFMTTYRLLREAILDKKQVTCFYHGHFREVCPHVLGTKKGQDKVLVFQFGGGSSSELSPLGEWRCMVVDEIERPSSREGRWYSGVMHLRPQTCVDEVEVQVELW